MAFGRFKVLAGDFAKGNRHQLLRGHLMMKASGAILRQKISLSNITALEVASEESVNRLGGALGWGLAGEALLGPVGLLAGLLRGGRANEVTFICKLRDGRKFLAVADSRVFSQMREVLITSQFNGTQYSGASIKTRKFSLGKVFVGIAALVVLAIVIGAITGNPSPAPPIAGPFSVTMQLTNTGGAHPIIEGQTNLPDGMQLIVSISRRHGRIMGQSDVIVSGGQFKTETFSNHGSPYDTGTYTVEVSSSLASLEPASVQTVIGSNGQMMMGKAVVPDTFGDGASGKVIDFYDDIIIP